MENITFENGSMTAAMEPDFNLLGIFQEHFKRYLRYREEPPGDAEILKVSFQFLRGSQDRQLGEIVGLVGSQDLPEVTSRRRPLRLAQFNSWEKVADLKCRRFRPI